MTKSKKLGGIKRYYNKVDTHISQAYKLGRDFEYAGMRFLRRRGWHVMRRFGSIGVLFCSKCGVECSRVTRKCPNCNSKTNVVKASLDWTGFKNGLYVMVTAKFSSKNTTMYLDDKYWQNLVTYAQFFNAIPLFQGVNADRKIYFVDLRTLMTFDAFYRYKVEQKPNEKAMERLINEAWATVDECNRYIGETAEDKCKVCAKKARWAATKANMLNILNRILWRAGVGAVEDDLTKILNEQVEIQSESDEEQ